MTDVLTVLRLPHGGCCCILLASSLWPLAPGSPTSSNPSVLSFDVLTEVGEPGIKDQSGDRANSMPQ